MKHTTVEDVWDLQASTDWLSTASGQLHAMSSSLETGWTRVGRGAERLRCSWSGARADSYAAHAGRLRDALGTGSGLAIRLSEAVGDLGEALDAATSSLDASFARAKAGSIVAWRFAGQATFVHDDDEVPPAIAREQGTAATVLHEAQQAVSRCAATLATAGAEFETLARAWHGTAHGAHGWDVPEGHVGTTSVTQHGNQVVVNLSDGDDRVEITTRDGKTVITVNGQEYVYEPGVSITLNAGGGNDSITIDGDLPNRVRIVAGTGDDQVVAQGDGNHLDVFGGGGHDSVQTGNGFDYVSGGAGHDYVDSGSGDDLIAGGAGNDVLYGMGGQDVILAGSGDDYLDGARGDDTVLGMDGNDIVSGGRGDDVVVGGDGDDKLYSGLGSDQIVGGAGQDNAFYTEGTRLDGTEGGQQVVIQDRDWSQTFDIQGDDAYRERVLADLDMLASSANGQQLLDQLVQEAQADGKKFWIADTTDGNSASSGSGSSGVNYNDSRLLISGSEPWFADGRPPVVGLFHEFGHLNQFEQPDAGRWNGKKHSDGTPLIERQNVGLPWDHDGDPNTPDVVDPDYSWAYTENAQREEFGLPKREKY